MEYFDLVDEVLNRLLYFINGKDILIGIGVKVIVFMRNYE